MGLTTNVTKYEYKNFFHGVEFHLDKYMNLEREDEKIVFSGGDKEVVKKLKRKRMREKLYSKELPKRSSIKMDIEEIESSVSFSI